MLLSIFSHHPLYKQLSQDRDLRAACSAFVTTVLFSASLTYLCSLYSLVFFLPLSLLFEAFRGRSSGYHYLITLQSAAIGLVFGCSLIISFSSIPLVSLFFRYLLVMSLFHFSEFFFTAITNRRSLKIDSFLLNHSIAYWIAAVSSWIEFSIESYFFPQMKLNGISYLGLFSCLVGEIIRKSAMVQAGTGFTHQLAQAKRPDHKLVTNGVYSYARHPGYSGWFLWSISTQIVLCNPICLILYALASHSFFSDRIYEEERDLLQFFGNDYHNYQRNVWSGIPGVEGYSID